ncbi:S8 family serine peptidase [Streptomyces canus]|uniref:S8 family serine peptidase n=1 Tax=Streptomyces canus TaxID=58343 RepID=UPI002E27BD05|nr:S8 family serine peptidase [Streptomyces canus]
MGFTQTVRALSAAALAGGLILVAAPGASADQTRRDQWALDTLQAQAVWKISKGKGITVAVIDSGVNATHVDLKGNVLKGHDFQDGDDDATPEATDSSPEHGTAMASVIAGHGHGAGAEDGVIGLAPEAKILPIRDGGVGYADEIRYAVDHGASVINMSVSTTQESSEDRDAIAYALKKDVLVVTASGNSGRGDVVDYPKKYPGVLTVGGVDRNGEIWKGSDFGPELLLTAPATRIVHAGWPGNKLSIGDGTSDSAAFVSAAAALLRSKFPDLTAGQVANRLVKTAVLPASAKGLSLPDEKYGYGSIRPLAALTEDIPAGSKYGPLTAPSDEGSSTAGAGTSDTESAAENEKADQKQMLFFVVLGVVALVVIGLIVLLIVKLSRRNKNKNGGPGDPGAYPQYGQQPLPPQQNPYQQPVSPQQQNPYQQQSHPPQGQWPPQ